jgi:hypothetical protein
MTDVDPIPVHLDVGFAISILAVLALLAFSPWFRRFALVCVALLIVAAGVVYMKINWEKEQALATECGSFFDPTLLFGKITVPQDVIEMCKGWLDDHPQAKEQVTTQKMPGHP